MSEISIDQAIEKLQAIKAASRFGGDTVLVLCLVGSGFEYHSVQDIVHEPSDEGDIARVDVRHPAFMPSKKRLEGYDEAVAKVEELAQSNDNWMTPTDDEPHEPESFTDYGHWLQEEQEGWEQTDHFGILYGRPISDMARDIAEQNGLEGEHWLDIRADLLNEFWETWAEKHNAYEHWQKNIERKPKKKRTPHAKK